MADPEAMKAWARKMGANVPEDEEDAIELSSDEKKLAKTMAGVTIADVLQMPDLTPEQRQWLENYATRGEPWAILNNPPGFVTNEGCWDKAKKAADHAGAMDRYAFATWWYKENC